MSSGSPKKALAQAGVKQHVSYTWVLDNFTSSTSAYFYYVSPRFSPPSTPDIQFKLFHYSKNSEDHFAHGHCTTDQSLIVLSASYDRYDLVPNRDELTVKLSISLIDANGVRKNTSECISKFVRQELICNGQYTISRSYLLDPSNGLLINDKLTIYCEVEVLEEGGAEALVGGQYRAKGDIASSIMSEDFGALLMEGTFADVTLLVGEGSKPFKAHKAVLSARSKVFAAMFAVDLKETQESRVKIPDLQADVCQQLLTYMYTGRIDQLEQFPTDLLAAADKYQLEYMKIRCEQHLMNSVLSIESVATLLLLSDMHQALDLKRKCVDFLTDNVIEVMKTDGWNLLVDNRIELTVELLAQLAVKSSTKGSYY